MKTFQKVAAIMEDGQGRIHGDDLIAASFLAPRRWTSKPFPTA